MQLYGKDSSPRLGADKRPWCAPSATPGSIHLRGASTFDGVLRNLQGFFDRPLVDRTGLEGSFEWEVELPVYPKDPNREAAELSTVLREQLGLRLQPVTSPFDVVVIDSLEMPDLN
jgi:uncharacterized protein (TIGR03435 family)